MRVVLSDLDSAIKFALKHYGYSSEESEIISKILLFAQLRGNNQGIAKLVGAGMLRKPTYGKIEITRETPSSALVNGNGNHAMIVLDYTTDLAINKAKRTGISICGNYGSGDSTGALGYYVNRIARSRMIGIAFASAPFQAVAPYGGIDPLLCTNPIAFGVPTSGDPLILDFATSAIAYFGLVEAQVAGRTVPSQVGYDSDGNNTTDPQKIMTGAIRAFAGHKGSGLSIIVQILAGPLLAAGYLGRHPGNAGNLLLAFDPALFVDLEELSRRIDEIISIIKTSRRAPGVDEILLPGERGFRKANAAHYEGAVDIDDDLWVALSRVGF